MNRSPSCVRRPRTRASLEFAPSPVQSLAPADSSPTPQAPHPPQNPGLTSPSSLQLPVLDLPLQCALMTFTPPLWAGVTRIPHKSALRHTSNQTAMITRQIVNLSDSPVNCPSCLFCILFSCLAGLSLIFYVGLGFKYSPEKRLFNKYALGAALLLVFPVLRCTRSCLRKKKSGWAGGQRPVMHSDKLLLVSVWVTPKHYETLRFFFHHCHRE